MKLKPYIVFKEKGPLRKIEAMKKDPEFRGKCVLATSGNAWMNEATTQEFVDKVIGGMSFGRRLLAWDTYACYLTPDINKISGRQKGGHCLYPRRLHGLHSSTRCLLEQALQAILY